MSIGAEKLSRAHLGLARRLLASAKPVAVRRPVDIAPRSQLLADADTIINGDRNNQYGPPTQDFARTAAMWSAYLGVPLEPHDVAAMMMLLKVSRIRWSPEKRDHWLDAAGYAACGWECADELGDSAGE